MQNGDGSWTLTDLRSGSPDGTDMLRDVELLHFSDQTIVLGTVGPPPDPLDPLDEPPDPENFVPVAVNDVYSTNSFILACRQPS